MRKVIHKAMTNERKIRDKAERCFAPGGAAAEVDDFSRNGRTTSSGTYGRFDRQCVDDLAGMRHGGRAAATGDESAALTHFRENTHPSVALKTLSGSGEVAERVILRNLV